MNVPLLRKYSLAALVTTAAISLSAPVVRAETLHADGVYFGASGGNNDGHPWALFTFEQTLGDSDIIAGDSFILGDIGAAGNGRINISGGSTIHGNAYYHTGGSYISSGGASITGSKISNGSTDSFLGQGVTDAMTAAAHAKGLELAPDAQTPSAGLPSMDLVAGTNDRYILTLSNFTLTNQNLILEGDASSSFVFNITSSFQVSHSTIFLTGGLTANNVIFNYSGTAPVVLNSANMSGIILAADPLNYQTSSVQVTAGNLPAAEIIADKVTLTGGATIQGIVSP